MNARVLKGLLTLFLMTTGVEQIHAQKSTPVASGTNFNISSGSTTVQVGPASGARIRSLKYGATELLFTATTGNWGSTFWPSPQAYWTTACRNTNPPNNGCWPPPANLDADNTTYTGGLVASDTSVNYAGTADNSTHLRFRKIFWSNSQDSTLTNRYFMINATTTPIAFAPWEITRFPGGGITFYPKGTDTLQGTQALINMVRDSLGVRWFVYDSATIPASGTPKIWGDGGPPGWYAHVDKNRVLFLKKFRDTPRAKNAPAITKEAECELYTANAKNYQEKELQGSFDTIPANDSVSWDVRWVVRKLPDSVAVRVGASLLNFVNQTVSGLSTPTALQTRDEVSDGYALDYSGNHIALNLTNAANVSLSLVDPKGREVSRLHSGKLSSGSHSFSLNAHVSASGVYWLILSGPSGEPLSRKAIIRFRE